MYKRQGCTTAEVTTPAGTTSKVCNRYSGVGNYTTRRDLTCLLYTSDAADERSSVDLGGRRIIKKKNKTHEVGQRLRHTHNPEQTSALAREQKQK